MSHGTLSKVMIRIKGAKPESPIAVFRTGKEGMLDAVFASTLRSHQMIRDKHPALIGVYDSTMAWADVESELAQNVLAAH